MSKEADYVPKMIQEYLHTCSHCNARNWTGEQPLQSMQCSVCFRVFHIKQGLGGIMSRWVRKDLEKPYQFRTFISDLSDEFPPTLAYIYDEFAVFEFDNMIDSWKLLDDKKDKPDKYKHLWVDYSMTKIVLIDKKAKEEANAT